ncbi:FAD/NAD(P)-binding domain-containing protein [Exidia glandulosa HHB12029]|uniref:FAD/NAD(P)-binding domain-containing protein n=1 Tax=Exidia glandulosa HHB12029 TaxID=1314781 RepID=A0A165LNF9_EXIGL|nr:FAD/NAD(P)-binding domain-containing protein [Exidia glandulosa HHB12029]
MAIAKPKQHVVIVGGSLAGLFNGVALSRLGHRVTILERNTTPLLHNQGAGVVFGGDLLEYFSTYDRTRTPLYTTIRTRQHLDQSGAIVHSARAEQHMTSWDLLYHLLRANYDGINSDYVTPPARVEGDGEVEYRYDCRVTAIEDLGEGKGVSVTYKTHANPDAEETLTGDMLIAADGASSFVRTLLFPDAKRTYAGYIGWRGTAPENAVLQHTAETLFEKFTFYMAEGLQFLTYLIPGKNGSVKPGERVANWVWYSNYAEGSPELAEVLTDRDGKQHRITLPPGGVQPAVWEKQKQKGQAELPPQLHDLMDKTEVPFVQAITDNASPRASLWGGRLLIVGDALAGFRPHTAASTSQAAMHALMVARLFRGETTLEKWERDVLNYAKVTQARGIMLGNRSQFGGHATLL